MIYFDNAATSGKKPQIVISAVESALKNYSANPGRSGYEVSLKTAEKVYEARQKAALFFGCKEPQNVIFTLNCTQSINFVLKGVLRRGDHVIVSSLEHNAVMRPLKKIGNTFDIAGVSLGNDDETVENFKKRIKSNTRMIFCTAASNVLGKTLPLEALGKLCKSRGILFAVDAAQGAGVLPIDMEKMNIDFLCVAPHKGLYAPMGVGILLCRKKIPETIIEGGTGTNSLELRQPYTMPERFESGTVNLPGIMGAAAGMEFVKTVGMEKIYRHEMEIATMIFDGLYANKNVVLYTKRPTLGQFAAVIPFNIKGKQSEETAAALNEKGVAVRAGYHCAPFAHMQMGTLETGAVRISLSAFNTKAEAQKFLNLL